MSKGNLVYIQLITRPLRRKAMLGYMYDEGCFEQKLNTESKIIDYKTAVKEFNALFTKLDTEQPNTYIKQKIENRWTILHKQNYEVLMYNLTHMY